MLHCTFQIVATALYLIMNEWVIDCRPFGNKWYRGWWWCSWNCNRLCQSQTLEIDLNSFKREFIQLRCSRSKPAWRDEFIVVKGGRMIIRLRLYRVFKFYVESVRILSAQGASFCATPSPEYLIISRLFTRAALIDREITVNNILEIIPVPLWGANDKKSTADNISPPWR